MFYVSVKNDSSTLLALGPFITHGAALEHVDEVRRYVVDHYRDGWSYAFGTSRDRLGHEPGALNRQLEYSGPGALP